MLTANKLNLRANKQHLNLIWVIHSSDIGHGLGHFFTPALGLEFKWPLLLTGYNSAGRACIVAAREQWRQIWPEGN